VTSSDHLAYREALGAYALGALPDAEAEQVRHHLQSCSECRAELDSLRSAVDALPASVDPVPPPPELKDRLMAIVTSEAALLRAAGDAADQPAPAPRRRRWSTGPRFPLAVGFAVACLAAVVVALVTTGTSTRTVPVQVTAQVLGQAHASLAIRGDSAQLNVAGLPAPPPGHVDELWVKRGDAPPAPAGTFILRTGSVALSVPVRSGDQVLMTIEPGRGTAQPTTAPLLVARV